MFDYSVHFIVSRTIISCIGIVGNVFLILSIVQTKFSQVKSFERFLLGLAASNLEEIIIVSIYDTITIFTSSASNTLLCKSLKFLTVFGENASILFTVLISIFRYQKLRDAKKRVNLPVYLDSTRSVCMVSGVGVIISVVFGAPIFATNFQTAAGNLTSGVSSCPPDFFHCTSDYCPLFNHFYKYLFILVCKLLPLIIITVTSCLIVTVLLSQRRMVMPSESGSGQFTRRNKGLKLQRSSVAVLAAMALFQVEWSLYVFLQLAYSPSDFPFLGELMFFVSTSYTSISPYVYGIGNNLFSYKNFMKR